MEHIRPEATHYFKCLCAQVTGKIGVEYARNIHRSERTPENFNATVLVTLICGEVGEDPALWMVRAGRQYAYALDIVAEAKFRAETIDNALHPPWGWFVIGHDKQYSHWCYYLRTFRGTPTRGMLPYAAAP